MEHSMLDTLDERFTEWGWQTVLDTLAVGENLPLRLIDIDRLQNLEDELKNLCRDVQVIEHYQQEMDRYPDDDALPELLQKVIGRESLKERIQKWVSAVDGRLNPDENSARTEDQPREPLFPEPARRLFGAVFSFLERRIFLTLPSNAIPLDNLSRNAMPCWRWYTFFWLYQYLVTDRHVLELGDKIALCENAYEVPGLYFGIFRVPTQEQRLLLLVGPVLKGDVSPLAEYEYEKNVVGPAVNFIDGFYHRLANHGVSVKRERFMRAAHAEPPTPRPNLKRRTGDIQEGLRLLGNWRSKQLPRYHSVLRVAVLWGLFIAQRNRDGRLQKQLPTGGAIVAGLRLERDYHEVNAEELPWLLVRITQGDVRLDISQRSAQDSSGDGGYGFHLAIFESSSDRGENTDFLSELRLQFSHVLIRSDQKARLLDNKRVLIFHDWLQNRFGTLMNLRDIGTGDVGESQQSSYQICRWVNELVRADITSLYAYEVDQVGEGELKRIGIYFHSPWLRKHSESLNAVMVASATGDCKRRQSICYRAFDDRKQKVVFDYDPETGDSVPPKERLALSEDGQPLVRNVIATPIDFNGRHFGILEVKALATWRFRWGHQIPLQQVVSAIAPFLYQHRYLEALRAIQKAILDLHGERTTESKLYNTVCMSLTNLFLCEGATLWVRDSGNHHLYRRKGFHGIKRNYAEIDLGAGDSFTDQRISRYHGVKVGDRPLAYPLKVTPQTTPLLDRAGLINAGVETLTVVPVTGEDGRVMATVSLYGKDHYEPYAESWNGIFRFASGYVSLVVEAADAFAEAKRFGAAIHVHELYHDAATISDKGKKLARSLGPLRQGTEQLSALLRHPWFKERMQEAHMLGVASESVQENLLDLPRRLNTTVFKPDEDLAFFSETLDTRIKSLFGGDGEMNNEARDFLRLTGDDRLTRMVAWDEREEWHELRDAFLAVLSGNDQVQRKGLFLDTDRNKLPGGLEVFMRKTLLTTVLRNLFTNAVKYSIKHKSIDVTLGVPGNDMLVFSIVNRGSSFADEDEVYDVLNRGKRGSNTKGVGGFGMGLYYVQQLSRHLMDTEFRFLERRRGDGNSDFTAELIFPRDRVR